MPNRQQRRKATAIARRAKAKGPTVPVRGAAPKGDTSAREQMMRASGRVTIVAADATNATAPRQFRMVANTGEPMRIYRWDDPVIVDLETIHLDDPLIPALYDHSAYMGAVVGQVETLAIENNQLIASGRFTVPARREGEYPSCAEEVLRLADAGYQWQASVGADPGSVERIEAGSVGKANWGREYPGPCVIGRNCRLREISFVVLGGDRRTSVVTSRIKGSAMTFEQWLLAMGFDDAAALSDVQRANLELMYQQEYPDGDTETETPAAEPTNAESEPATEDEPANAAARPPAVRGSGTPAPRRIVPPQGGSGTAPATGVAAHRAAIAAEERRIADVRRICAGAGNPEMTIGTGDAATRVSVQAHAIEQGWDANRTELEVLRRRRPEAPNVIVRSHERDCTIQALEGAMILRCGGRLDHPSYTSPRSVGVMPNGRPKLPAWLRAGINDANRNRIMDNAQRYADYSAVDLCREAIRLDGRVVSHGRHAEIQAAISGLNLQNVFTTSINAILLATYWEAEDTTQGWVREQDVADYRLQERPRMNKGPRLTKRSKGGTADHGTRDDGVESYKIAHFAQQLEVDEIDFVNDNLSALSDLPVEMAYAAARLRPDLVYGIILDNPTLATTARALFNTTDGSRRTGKALSSDNLKSGIAAMMLFRENGVNLGLRPTHLLVPPSLKHLAAELVHSATVFKSTGSDTTKEFGSDNSIRTDNLTPVSDPRLENGVIHPDTEETLSGSSTDWFLVCAAHTIEVGYLRGTGRSPRVRSWKHDREGKYGMGWDIDMSIGAAPLDWKGMEKNEA